MSLSERRPLTAADIAATQQKLRDMAAEVARTEDRVADVFERLAETGGDPDGHRRKVAAEARRVAEIRRAAGEPAPPLQ